MADAEQILLRKLVSFPTDLQNVLLTRGRLLREKIRRDFLSGTRTTARSLRKRSGKLFNSVFVEGPINKLGSTSVNIEIRQPYAATHFGVRGKRTTIRPRRKQALAIPLTKARDARGVPLGRPTDSRFQPTFIQKGVIFSRPEGASSPITPLFKLKNSVVVRARIDLVEDIQRPEVRPLERAIGQAILRF